jgi:tetratricopeptide (TPR) repeat protein
MPRRTRQMQQTLPAAQSQATLEESLNLESIHSELLGERLRRARLEKKITQRALCENLFTSAYLSSLELGKTRPTFATLASLAQRLDKPIEYFLRKSTELASDMDAEVAQTLQARLALLVAHTTLAITSDERAAKTLDSLSGYVNYLSPAEQARYYYLQAHYANLSQHPAQALEQLEQALDLFSEQDEPELSILLEIEQGQAYYLQGRYTLALTHYSAGLEKLSRAKEASRPEARMRWKLLDASAHCYLALGDRQQAMQVFQQALAANTTQNPASQADLHYQQANTYTEQGDYERAAFSLGRSYQDYIQSQIQLSLINNYLTLAQLELQAGHFDQAEAQAQAAFKLAQLSLQSDDYCQELKTLVLLAKIYYQQEKLDEARHYLDKSLASLQTGATCNKPEELGALYQTAAEIEAKLEHRETAENYYQKAIELVQPDPALATSLAEIYRSYGQQLKDWGEIDRAFDYIEKAFRQREAGRATNSKA